jgi:glutaredoxin
MPAQQVTLYTRAGCHLCDDALAVIDDVRRQRPFELRVVDIDSDPELVELYGHEVPVVFVGNGAAFRFRVDAAALRLRLEASEATP